MIAAGRCGSCGAHVQFIPHESTRKPAPIEPGHDPAGNVVVYRNGAGRWVYRVLGKDEDVTYLGERRIPHFAACPNATAHRTRR